MLSIPLGPFNLQTPIRKGGMGEVWRGEHIQQQVPVAIKVMTGARARQRRYRDAFRNEVRAVAALNHPGIVKILDHGMVSPEAEELSGSTLVAGSPYLVMELASRGSLDQLRGVLAWSDIKGILIALLDALAHAHARGVIHRDIKPGNILLASDEDLRPGVKLTDFGLAHATDEALEEADLKGARAGTPRYMAPELFEGRWRDYAPWSDLYAIGCLAYELSSNRPLFPGDTFQDLKRQHLYDTPGHLAPLQPVPEGFERWILRLVQKKPHERFARAADAAWALLTLGDPEGDKRSVLATDFSMSPSRTTNLFSTMSGFSATSTLMFPDPQNPFESEGMADRSTVIFPENNLPHQSTFLLGRSFASADTYMLPEHGIAGARTFLFDGVKPQEPARGRSQILNPVGKDVQPLPVVSPPHPLTWRRNTPPDHTTALVGAGLRLFALRTYRMVGRERERDAIWDALTAVKREGRPRLLLLSGAAGFGKSRLAEWICERAHEVGSGTLLRASHSPLAGPAHGLPRLVSRHLACVGLNRADVRRRARALLESEGVTDDYEWDALTELMMAPLAEERAARAKPIRFSSPTERYVLLQRLMERIGRHRPVVAWLDDVQWGADSLWFAQYILKSQSLRPTPVLFIMTARDESLAERPVEAHIIQQLMALPGTQQIHVGPLPEVDREELVRELLLLDGDLAQQVAERCKGNPLFAVQLVGDWISRGVLEVGANGFTLRSGEEANLPDDLHAVWTQRIARLLDDEPPESGPALEIAALLGQEVDSLEWEAACQEADIQLTFHLYYKLLAARLAEAGSNTWAFTHNMLRESLERNARDQGRWPHLHRACARMLLKRYLGAQRGVSERLGRHLLAAGDLDEALVPLLLGAREHIDGSEFRIADELLRLREQAMDELALDDADPRWGPGWLLDLELAFLRGQLVPAAHLASRIAQAARDHAWNAVLPDALIWGGRVALARGELDSAQRRFDEARTLVEARRDTARRVDCLRGSGQVAFRRGLVEPAMDSLREALDLARSLKDKRRVAECLQALRPVILHRGDHALAADLIKQAHALHESVGNRHGLGECLHGLGEIALVSDHLDRAAVHFQRGFALFERLGAQGGIAACLLGLAEIDRRRQRAASAEERYRQVLHLHDATGGAGEAIRPRIGLALVLLSQGRPAEAHDLLTQAAEAAERDGRRALLSDAYATLLRCDALRARWDDWHEHLQRLCAVLLETAAVEVELPVALIEAARAAARADRDDDADHALRLALILLAPLHLHELRRDALLLRDTLQPTNDLRSRPKACPRCLRAFDAPFRFCTEDGQPLASLLTHHEPEPLLNLEANTDPDFVAPTPRDASPDA